VSGGKRSRFSSQEEATIEEGDLAIEEEVAHMETEEAIKVVDPTTMEIVLLVVISVIDPGDASTVAKKAT
jgi:hypothetical protein